MAIDGGVWAKIYPDPDGGAPGAAKIGMNSVGVDNAPEGKPAGATDLADGSYTYSEGGKTYRVLAFTDDGRSDLTLDVDTAGFADVLIVAGGGAGHSTNRGAGGGGFYEATDYYVPAGTHTVTIGAGGPAANNVGSPSSFLDFTMMGGGGGSSASYVQTGGSGGGGVSPLRAGGPGVPGQGNDGSDYAGGGAGAAAVSVTGGAGAESTLTGTSVTYSAGGNYTGGGNGGPNTGDGGEGPTGTGGSGIVIVRVEI